MHAANLNGMRAAGCQDPARTAWRPDASAQPRLATDELWIGEWACPGERRPWAREVSHHAAIEILRQGVHLRELGRDRAVVEPTLAVLHPAGDEFRMASPTARPQRSTIVYLSPWSAPLQWQQTKNSLPCGGELAGELGLRAPRAHRLDPAAALAHARLVAARDPSALHEAAIELVRRLAPAPQPVPPARASWRRLAEVMQHEIALRHRERLTLDAIANAVGASPFHASRVFRAVTGDTVHRHLVRVRLRVALLALAGDGDLAAIAVAAGFSSHSHFTSAFRAEFGVSPSAVRSLVSVDD
jgi:AraC-like DNA-binding protein